jgi:hypothetical protein
LVPRVSNTPAEFCRINLEGCVEAITGALVRTEFSPTPVGDGGFGLADGAQRRLARLVRALDGSRDLVIDLVERRVPRWFCTSSSGGSIARTRTRWPG